MAFSVEYGGARDPETVSAAVTALRALVDLKGWVLVNEHADFKAAPAESMQDQVCVTWWIHED